MEDSLFFREATLRICGSLEIEKAMHRCLQFLTQHIPATHMAFHIYDRGFGIVETVAMATVHGGRTMALKTPLSAEGRHQVEVQRSMRTKRVDRSGNDAVAGPVARQLGMENAPCLLLDLALDGSFVGTVSVFSETDIPFNPHHVRRLSMLNEPFAIALANCLRYRELTVLQDMLTDDNRYLRDELRSMAGEAVVGAEFGLKPVMELVRRVAPMTSPVLLLGETGAGKEVVAHAIHALSPRSGGPFIRVNCGAIAESMMDTELFGHEKGAFTGAIARKRGRFERAIGGTIFLDEIGELPPEMQVRLLRVLQSKEIERVGGVRTLSVDIRVIAATHRDLEAMLATGGFREDLYFRLRVFPITIPPLRHRQEDIPALVQHFIRKKAMEMKLGQTPPLSPGTLDRLMRYHWPGNVRELENVVERELIVRSGQPLLFQDIPSPGVAAATSAEPPLPADNAAVPLDQAMADHIQRALTQCNGRVEGEKGAARLLKIHPSTLRKRMSKLGIVFGRRSRQQT